MNITLEQDFLKKEENIKEITKENIKDIEEYFSKNNKIPYEVAKKLIEFAKERLCNKC